MSSSKPNPGEFHSRDPSNRFVTTQWSLIARAATLDDADCHAALQSLCSSYWFPLYAYARRRMDLETAQDRTQEFFRLLLEKNYLETADQNRGRFRSFLLTAFKHFLSNETDREQAVKRGGRVAHFQLDFAEADSRYSIQAVDELTPEAVFERQWVLTLLENVMESMKKDFAAKGLDQLKKFEALKPMIGGDAQQDYSDLSEQLGTSVDTLRVQVHRLRQRYREKLRTVIAATVSSPNEVDDEIKRLFELMG